MQRRSTRQKDNPATHIEEDPEADNPEDGEFADEQLERDKKPRGRKRKAPQEKKTKSDEQQSAKKPRGMRGLLKDLVEMPMDVLYEIFGQLEPIDLLHLSRTTKDLRNILMSRSSLSVWKEARANIEGLPDCPDDLSEPQYAELSMGKRCYDCQRNLSAHHIVWSARVRYCTKCLDRHFTLKDSLFAYARGYPEELAQLVPTVGVSKKHGRYTRERDMSCCDTDELWRQEYAGLTTAEEKEKWVKARVKERKDKIQHGEECAAWHARLLQSREATRASTVDERKALVVEHLKKMGWQEELERRPQIFDAPQNDPLVVKACQKEITERVLGNLEDHLNDLMESLKEKRITHEKKVLYTDRLTLLKWVYNVYIETRPANSVHPNTAELFGNPFVRDIVLSDPANMEFKEENLEAVQLSFDQLVVDWRKDMDTQFIALIKKSCPEYEFDSDKVLQLATSLFSCKSCENYSFNSHSVAMTPEQALVHKCAREISYGHEPNDPELRAIKAAIAQLPWNHSEKIWFNPKTLVLMTDLIGLCGLDPTRATFEDLDELDPIFECVVCNAPREGRATMRWSYVPGHANISHGHGRYRKDEKQPELVLLDDDEASVVRSRMRETRDRARARNNDLICCHCKQRGDSVGLPKHVKTAHNRPEVTDEDIVASILEKPVSEFRLWPPRPEKVDPTPAENAMDTT